MNSNKDVVERKIIEEIVSSEKKCAYQFELRRKLNLSTKTVSKALRKLESEGVIKREKAYRSGKTTYRITIANQELAMRILEATVKEPELSGFTDIPCLSCPYVDSCFEGGYYEPTSCQWLWSWIRTGVFER